MLDIVDTADEVGQASFLFVIPVDAAPDVYSVDVQASADGYENASASTTFDVIGSGDFFDNSTSDNFSDCNLIKRWQFFKRQLLLFV